MKRLLTVLLIVCLLLSNTIIASAESSSNNDAVQTIEQYIKAQNDHDWQTYINLQVQPNQLEIEKFIHNEQNISNGVGVLGVQTAKLEEIKQIESNADSEEIIFIVGIDYKVKSEDKYFFNGVNYRLVKVKNEENQWKILSVTDAPLEIMTIDGPVFNSDGEKAALKIINDRRKGEITNKAGKTIEKNIYTPEKSTKINSLSTNIVAASTPSDDVQPSTIRVRRVSLGVTQTVDFITYVKDVLPNEWGTTWASESLIAGAMACKTFGWYCVLHPLKPEYSADLTDNESAGQIYIPGSRNNSSSANTNAAIDYIDGQIIQGTRTTSSGSTVFYIFYAEYRKGTQGSENSSYYHSGIMSQYGTKYLADNGLASWYEMCQYYYNNALTSNYPWRSIGPIVQVYYFN